MGGKNRQTKVYNTCCTGFFLILQYILENSGYVVWDYGFDEDYAVIVLGACRILLAHSLTGSRNSYLNSSLLASQMMMTAVSVPSSNVQSHLL